MYIIAKLDFFHILYRNVYQALDKPDGYEIYKIYIKKSEKRKQALLEKEIIKVLYDHPKLLKEAYNRNLIESSDYQELFKIESIINPNLTEKQIDYNLYRRHPEKEKIMNKIGYERVKEFRSSTFDEKKLLAKTEQTPKNTSSEAETPTSKNLGWGQNMVIGALFFPINITPEEKSN